MPPRQDALFHPFVRTPPAGDACLAKVYDVFAGCPIQSGWCPQCFGPEGEAQVRAYADVRTAPRHGFDMIYFEHPACSGGLDTFLHWLPRALEISFFDRRLEPSFVEQMVRLGLLAWPEEWLVPLRELVCRASVNWFVNGDPDPLRRTENDGMRAMRDAQVGPELLSALCVLRVEPRSIAEWLLDIDTPAGWTTALGLLQEAQFLDDPSYYVLPEQAWAADFQAAHRALDRRARAGFHEVFNDAVLTAKWERTFERDPPLADALSAAESTLALYRPQPDPVTEAADRELLQRAVSRHVAFDRERSLGERGR